MSDTKQADIPGFRARDIAAMALRGALEEIAEIQQRMALRALMETVVGHKALPIREFYRRLPTYGNSMYEAPRYVALEAKNDAERLDVLYPMVEALEATFREEREQRNQDFFSAMAEHFRRQAKEGG